MSKIVVFDICFTIYNCNTTVEFFKFLKKKYFFRYAFFYIFNRVCILLRLYDFFDRNRVIFLKGMSKERLNESLNLYYQERLEQKINMIILDKLNHFKDNGYDIYFISASIEPIVKFISSKLGAKAGFGTTLLECNGDYNGNIDNDLLGKNSKKNILENIINIDSNIDILNSYAFSDSENDLNQWNVIGNKFLVVNNDIYEYER